MWEKTKYSFSTISYKKARFKRLKPRLNYQTFSSNKQKVRWLNAKLREAAKR